PSPQQCVNGPAHHATKFYATAPESARATGPALSNQLNRQAQGCPKQAKTAPFAHAWLTVALLLSSGPSRNLCGLLAQTLLGRWVLTGQCLPIGCGGFYQNPALLNQAPHPRAHQCRQYP